MAKIIRAFDPRHKPLISLLAATAITTNATTNAAAVTGLAKFKALVLLLTLSAKTMDAGTVLDIYIQTSPDEGTTWDDIAHFTQVTATVMDNGTYVAKVLNDLDAGFVDRATRANALAANSIVDYFCDRVRVSYVSANFAGSDTITVKVEAIALP